MTENMAKAGVRCVGYWTQGDPATLAGYIKRFPEVPRLNRLEDALNSGADLALISAIPADRADLTVQAMQHGMDVMSDKPGCTSFEHLDRIRQTVSDTGTNLVGQFLGTVRKRRSVLWRPSWSPPGRSGRLSKPSVLAHTG